MCVGGGGGLSYQAHHLKRRDILFQLSALTFSSLHFVLVVLDLKNKVNIFQGSYIHT